MFVAPSHPLSAANQRTPTDDLRRVLGHVSAERVSVPAQPWRAASDFCALSLNSSRPLALFCSRVGRSWAPWVPVLSRAFPCHPQARSSHPFRMPSIPAAPSGYSPSLASSNACRRAHTARGKARGSAEANGAGRGLRPEEGVRAVGERWEGMRGARDDGR